MTTRKAAGAARESGDPQVCDQLAGQIAIIATLPTVDFQAAFLKARFGLAADRARLVAAIHFGEARQ